MTNLNEWQKYHEIEFLGFLPRLGREGDVIMIWYDSRLLAPKFRQVSCAQQFCSLYAIIGDAFALLSATLRLRLVSHDYRLLEDHTSFSLPNES